ncbi:MAG: enterotoxin [Verrucomicrobiota bacterium]
MNASSLLKSPLLLVATLIGMSDRSLAVETGAILAPPPEASVAFPGPLPGVAKAVAGEHSVELSNAAIAAGWTWLNGSLKPVSLVNKLSNQPLAVPDEAFILEFRDGHQLRSSALKVGPAKLEILAADPQSVGLAGRFAGQQITLLLSSANSALQVKWSVSLRDGANYIRQQVSIAALHGEADLAKIILVSQALPGADISGKVAGSPIVDAAFFTGFEHPMSISRVETYKLVPDPDAEEGNLAADHIPTLQEPAVRHRATAWLERALPIQEGKVFSVSSVQGVVPEGQLRRGVLYYIERERAHAYRPFLHYNSWYDIGYFTPYDEKDCLGVIDGFTRELHDKRGVKMDSFLFDDGWDDTSKGGQWVFHKGFPNGFTTVKNAALKTGAGPGVWLSPWGGYGNPRIERRKSGEAAGYETAKAQDDPAAKPNPEYDKLFALSGPKYYASFHAACVKMVRDFGINQFKLDGTGNINSVVPGSKFGSDFEAAISLIGDLRGVKPDLFINLTTGTWPSPFWLTICDSIWRGGDDHDFAGVGPKREQWITYRDGDTHERIVKGGPLFPLNSLMLHGIIYARKAHDLNTDPSDAFTHEVRSYFGTGTQLQEMYISHDLLTQANWDELATCAKWSRANAATLVDTHWIGGSPRKLEVYGWASWSPRKAILTLRNPSDKAQEFTLKLSTALELPAGAPASYTLTSPYQQREIKELTGKINPANPVKFTLSPFEVLVFEALPAAD